MHFLARSSPDILDLKIENDTLTITPLTIGSAAVRVEAWDQGGSRVGYTFEDLVEGCPPEVQAGNALYFPFQSETEREDDYTSHYTDRHSYRWWETRISGELTWRIVDYSCRRDTIGVVILQELHATSVTSEAYPGNSEEPPIAIQEADTFIASVVGDKLIIPGHSTYSDQWRHCAWAGPGSSLELQWEYPQDSPETIEIDRLFGAGFGAMSRGSARMMRNGGLVEWELSCFTRETSYSAGIRRR